MNITNLDLFYTEVIKSESRIDPSQLMRLMVNISMEENKGITRDEARTVVAKYMQLKMLETFDRHDAKKLVSA